MEEPTVEPTKRAQGAHQVPRRNSLKAACKSERAQLLLRDMPSTVRCPLCPLVAAADTQSRRQGPDRGHRHLADVMQTYKRGNGFKHPNPRRVHRRFALSFRCPDLGLSFQVIELRRIAGAGQPRGRSQGLIGWSRIELRLATTCIAPGGTDHTCTMYLTSN